MRSVITRAAKLALAPALALVLAPASRAQDSAAPPVSETPETTEALAGDFLIVGIGGALVPSYDGSDDYVLTPVPLLQGSLAGVGINPRPGGLALDLVDDRDAAGVNFSLGPTARLRSNRDGQVEDDVVALLPDLDTAIEVGVAGGLSFPAVLNPYDSLSFATDVRWDIAGAHEGVTVTPSVSYATPLSRGMAAILSIGGEYADDDFMDYYYSVSPSAAAVTGLPEYSAGAGLRSVGATLLLGIDLNGDLTDGGFSLFVVGGHTRLLNDAKHTPFTAIRGSAGQWLGGAGIAHAF